MFTEFKRGSNSNNLSYKGLNQIKKQATEIKKLLGGFDVSNAASMQAVRKEFRFFIQEKKAEIVGKKETEKALSLIIENPAVLTSGSWYENH